MRSTLRQRKTSGLSIMDIARPDRFKEMGRMTFTPALFLNDLKIAFRSLARTKGLALTVVLTLALGIGANAAIFTLVRGVLLRPLVNRDEDRLIYIRQSAK